MATSTKLPQEKLLALIQDLFSTNDETVLKALEVSRDFKRRNGFEST